MNGYYAVVLVWDTGSDEGEVPVLIKVRAEDEECALQRGLKMAEDGTLYCAITEEAAEGTPEECMEINVDKSFATYFDDVMEIR